nr:hypothetical protein Iba_chr12eCG9890 [Ipomoea batatas]
MYSGGLRTTCSTAEGGAKHGDGKLGHSLDDGESHEAKMGYKQGLGAEPCIHLMKQLLDLMGAVARTLTLLKVSRIAISSQLQFTTIRLSTSLENPLFFETCPLVAHYPSMPISLASLLVISIRLAKTAFEANFSLPTPHFSSIIPSSNMSSMAETGGQFMCIEV